MDNYTGGDVDLLERLHGTFDNHAWFQSESSWWHLQIEVWLGNTNGECMPFWAGLYRNDGDENDLSHFSNRTIVVASERGDEEWFWRVD